ncbi:hypothetical protein Esti_003053 [Eimeria stiedai]
MEEGPKSQQGNMKQQQEEEERSQQQQQGFTMSLRARFSGIGISRHKKKVWQQQHHLQEEHMQQQKEKDTQRIGEQWLQDVEQNAQTQQKQHQQQHVEQRQQQQQSEEKRRMAEETGAAEELPTKPSKGSQQESPASADASRKRKHRWRRSERRKKHHQQHEPTIEEKLEGQPPERLQKQHEHPEVRSQGGSQHQEQRENEHSQQDEQDLKFQKRWRRRRREREKGTRNEQMRRFNAGKPEKLSRTSTPQPPSGQQLQHEQQQLDFYQKATQHQRQHYEQHSRSPAETYKQPDCKRRFKLRRRHRRARFSKEEKANTPQQQLKETPSLEAARQRQQQEKQGQPKDVEDGSLKQTVSKTRHKMGRPHRRARSDKDKKTIAQQQLQQDEHEVDEQQQQQMTELGIWNYQAERKKEKQQLHNLHQQQEEEKQREQVSHDFQRVGAASLQLSILLTPLDAKTQRLLPCGLDERASYRNATSEKSAAAATFGLAPAGTSFIAARESKSRTSQDETHLDESARLVLEAQEADRQQEQNQESEDLQRERHHTFFAGALEKLHSRRVPPPERTSGREGQQEETAAATTVPQQKKAEGGEQDVLQAKSSPSVKPKGSSQKLQVAARGVFEVGVRKGASRKGEVRRQPKPLKQQLQSDRASAATPGCNDACVAAAGPAGLLCPLALRRARAIDVLLCLDPPCWVAAVCPPSCLPQSL